MKKERKVLINGIFVNFLIGIIKLFSGLVFRVNALLADSIFTFADLVTDIMSIIGAKISKKRPNKYHPYGYGRVEYITNSFIGIILILVGLITLVHSIKSDYQIPPIVSLIIIIISLVMKYMLTKYYLSINKRLNSEAVEENIEEGKVDVLSTGLVGLVIILGQFSNTIHVLRYSDLVVSAIVCVLILKTGYVLLRTNTLNLLGTVEVNDELINNIKEEINSSEHVTVSKVELIKYGRYYKAHLVINMKGDISLKKAINIKKRIITNLKRRKDINIHVVNLDYELESVK